MLPDNWNEMTPAERQEFRLAAWASTERKGVRNSRGEAKYEARVKR